MVNILSSSLPLQHPHAAQQRKSLEDDLRSFDDVSAIRNRVYENVLAAAQTLPDTANQRHTLRLSDVSYVDPERFSLKQQKEALLSGRTLGRRLRGTWQLFDNATGNMIAHKKATVARVPFVTERGTIVHGGNEYMIANQLRLRPGVFARIKENGQAESHMNLISGKGISHRYFLDPEKGTFHVQIAQAKIPLMPLLKALGAKDDAIREAWGNELWNTNAQMNDASAITKLYMRLAKRRYGVDAASVDKEQAIRETFDKMELDPDVTESTLGKRFNKVNAETILAATKKLLAITRGEQEPDDRDHLAYQVVVGPEDLFAERLTKDYGGIRKNLLRRASFKGTLDVVQPGALTKQLEAVLLHSGLAQAGEEINPTEIIDKITRISRMGEGAMSSIEAVPDEARSVMPSHFGYIDPVRTPECVDKETEVFVRTGWKRFSEVTEYDEFACLVNGQIEFHRPEELVAEHYKGTMYGGKSEHISYLVTPNHRMYVRPCCEEEDGNWRIELPSKVARHRRQFLCGGVKPFVGTTLKAISVFPDSTDVSSSAEFVGWYLLRGCVCPKKTRIVLLTVPKHLEPANYKRVEELLQRLGLSYQAYESGFDVNCKRLAAYCSKFGEANQRYIPGKLLFAQQEVRESLYKALLLAACYDSKLSPHFQSVSPRLVHDFQRLAFSLGYSTRQVDEKTIVVETVAQRALYHNIKQKQYYTVDYDDMVYCAQVPGGLLYIRRGNTCGHWTGNSFRVGVDTYLSGAARKGKDGHIYAKFLNVKTGRPVWRSPQQLKNATIAFPGELDKRTSKRVGAMAQGKLKFVPREQVDYVLPHFEQAFSPLANLVPMKSAMKAQRMAMAGRMSLAGDSVIIVRKQTGDVFYGKIEDYEHESGDEALSVDKASKQVCWKSIRAKIKHKNSLLLYKVDLRSGRSVTATADHSFVTMADDGELQKIHTQDLVAGTPVPVVGRFYSEPSSKVWERVTQQYGCSSCPYDSYFLGWQHGAYFAGKELPDCDTASCPVLAATKSFLACFVDSVGQLVLPSWIFVTPQNYRRGFVGGFLAANATGNGAFYCDSAKIREALVDISASNGVACELLENNGFKFWPVSSEDMHPAWQNSGVIWDEVSSLTCLPMETCEYVYDLDMEDNVFVCNNGIVVHNTSQALPLSDPEAPFVQTGVPGELDSSYEERFGASMGAVFADKPGTVVSVKPEEIKIRYEDGTTETKEIYNAFPFNRKSITGSTKVTIKRANGDIWRGAVGTYVYQAEDQILSVDNNCSAWQPVTGFIKHNNDKQLLRVTTVSGKSVDVTCDHSLVTTYGNGQLVPLYPAECVIGQTVLPVVNLPESNTDLYFEAVVSIEEIPHEEFVYDFCVASSEMFAVNDGLLVHNTFMHNTPVVRPGQKVNAGSILASSNYTNKNGVAALGKNLRVAYVPFRGLNFEDAIVISESAAKKFTSEHMYQHGVEWGDQHKKGKRSYISLFPSKYDKETLSKMDDDGVVLPGTVVNSGDPLILAARQREQVYGRVHKKRASAYNDQSEVWKHHSPGVVTDVLKTAKGTAVLVKSLAQMQEGDKISGRYGEKGVISAIIPDDQMPRDKEGRPFEILANPLGIISRCYDDKTEFLTERGWVFGRDVLDSDKLLTFDPDTNTTCWGRQLSKLHSAPYCGDMLAVDTPEVAFCVTPNHPFWARPVDGVEWGRHTAENMRGKHFCVISAVSEHNSGNTDRIPQLVEAIVQPESWQLVAYDGLIYCPTVKTGYVVTRRNGKCVVASNTNPAQMVEAALGKIAAITGKPYKVQDFENIDDLVEFAQAELAKHGLNDLEEIFDPETEQKIPEVFTGNRFFMKLMHTGESKGQGRGIGGYTMEGTPARGGETGSKAVGLLEGNAVLSHGATAVLRDAASIRGQRNEEYWLPFLQGLTPAKPKVPLIYQKFIESLRAAGVNVVPDGPKLHIMAMTDKDVTKMAGDRFVTSGETVQFEKNQKPIPGGLFDPSIFGADGSRWGAIKLHEPMPNPVMEEPIRRMLGLTEKQLEAVLAGKQELHGMKGPKAVHAALAALNIDKEIAIAREQIKSGRKTFRDMAVRKLGYLKSAKKAGIHPAEWMLTKVPVLPPRFRPVAAMSDSGLPLVADANFLYKELLEANDNLKTISTMVEDTSEERTAVYHTLKAVTGLGDPVHPKLREKKVQGILRHVFGNQPKMSVLQRRLLSTNVDLVGRGVIAPDPELDMDHIGLPENKAWDVYSNFIKRRLRRRGMGLMEAAKHVDNRTDLAREELLKEMSERPVVVSRAPVLHRFGIMAFFPRLTKGDIVRISPLIVKGYGADHDGDDVLTVVLTRLSAEAKLWISERFGPGFLEARKMAFESSSTIPVRIDDNVYMFDLEDFPKETLIDKDVGCDSHIDFYSVMPGVEVLAFNQETNTLGWKAVTNWSEHRDREVEIVDLRSGRQIITDDDPRAVFGCGRDSAVAARFTPTAALENKVLVPRATRLQLDEKSAVKSFSASSYNKNKQANKLRRHIKLDESFGYLLGAIAGDGWCAHTYGRVNGVCICGQDDDVFTAVVKAWPTLFSDCAEAQYGRVEMYAEGDDTRYGDVSRIRFYASANAGLMFSDLLGHRAQNKHLPPFFLTAPKKFRIALFAGLMDTDGTICISKAAAKAKPQLMCAYASTSLRLIREVCLLAASLGIPSRIIPFTYRGDRKAWQIYFSSPAVKRWGGEGMQCKRKRDAISAVEVDENSASSAGYDVVPLTVGLVEPLSKGLRQLRSRQADTLYTAVRKAIKTNSISRQSAKRIISMVDTFIGENHEFEVWKQLVANEDVTWDPVVAVQKTGIKETGYDLTVPGFETFMSVDGVIHSNTMNYSVPVAEDAKQEAIERMLPSANLLSPADFKTPIHGPSQEYTGGLYAATSMKTEKHPRIFRNAKDVAAAFARGEIDIRDPVEILT